MAASDHLSGQQFFHASQERLPVGTEILPQTSKATAYEREGEAWRAHRVWASATEEHAAEWGPEVHEVALEDAQPHHDLTDFDYNASVSAGAVFGQYHGRRARVVRNLT